MALRRLFVALVFAITIIAYADRQVVALLKPALDQALGWTVSDYAEITTLFQVAASLALLFAGAFVDRVGVVRATALGLGGWSLAATAHAVASTVSQFVAARVALGVCESVGTPALVKSVALIFVPERRALVLGAINMAPNLAAVATPLAVSGLFAALGWRGTIAAIGVVGFLLLAAWLAFPFHRLSPGLTARGQERPIPIAAALADPRVWTIGAAKLLIDQAWWFMLFWLPDFLHRSQGLDVRQLGPPLAAIYLMAAAGALLGGLVPALLARSGIALATARRALMGVCALTVMPVAFVTGLHGPSAILLLGIALASHQAFSTNVFALVADRFPTGEVGAAMGFGAFCGNVGGIASLRLAGLCAASLGTLRPMFLITAFAYGVAWLVLGLMEPKAARPALRESP